MLDKLGHTKYRTKSSCGGRKVTHRICIRETSVMPIML